MAPFFVDGPVFRESLQNLAAHTSRVRSSLNEVRQH